MRPVIGITPDVGETVPRPHRPALPRYELKQAYVDAVIAAGGLPVVLPYAEDESAHREAIALCDGLVITGGAFDIPPALYGAAAAAQLGQLKPGRTAWELRLLREARAQGKPVLGICGGMQLLAVEAGATLHQDILTEVQDALDHEQKHDSREPDHAVRIAPGTKLAAIYGSAGLRVNSTHHQAVRDPGRALITARAPDGVAEAIELDGAFALGVQWHPELLGDFALYSALVKACAQASRGV